VNHSVETTQLKDFSNQRWLILSHGFNMDGRASSQTITDKMPYLLEAGIQPTVFSAITGIKDERFLHKQYLAWGPAAFRFDFRHWIANKYGRGFIYKLLTRTVSLLLAPLIGLEKLILGYSSQWSWAMPAFIHGYRLIRTGKVDLVYSTGGAWSAHLAGLWLKKFTGVKWIAEIHDPLVIRSSPADDGFATPRNRDARFRKSLETSICQFANAVWWFTDGALHYAKVRNPILNTKGHAHGFMVLPGAEPPGGLTSDSNHRYDNVLNLAHSGSLAKDRSISTILHALHFLFKKYPEARQQIRIHVYGAPLDSLTKESLEQYQYHDVLIDHGRLERDPITGISGRERVVQALQKSDVLILLHGNNEWCAEYIPSKFYEYLWTGRPIWGITHRNPQLDQMLLDRDSYLSHESDKIGIEMALERIWLDWQKQALPAPTVAPIGVKQAVATILNTI
jgi:glycosyltransferase involved in cell wall biosynthesis